MVSALFSGLSGLGSSPGLGQFIVISAKILAGSNPALDYNTIQGGGGEEILLVALCYSNWDKLQPDGPPGFYADFACPRQRSMFVAPPELGGVNFACLLEE